MLGRRAPWRHAVVLLVVAACALLALFGIIGPGAGNRSERFEAKQITVQPAGERGVRIREVVDQDFGTADRHGYRRFIPHDFGEPTEVTASSPDARSDLAIGDNGQETEIRIGDPDKTVTGQHRYVLSYTLPDAHLSGGELALDIIGTAEMFETGRFEFVVTGFELDDPLCNVGRTDSSGGCELVRDGDVYRAVISPLEPGDGVTIGGTIVGRTEVDEPPIPDIPERRSTNRGPLALAMIPLGLAGAGAVFAISRWRGRNEVFSGGAADAAYGTLPNPSSTDGATTAGVRLVADDDMDELATIEFVPPKGIEPWQGAVLLTERIDNSTIGAWFSGLAAHDGITLDKEGHDLVLGSGPKRSELDPAAAAHIDKILDGRDRVELGTYDKKFATAWADVRKDQVASIIASGWWRRLPPGATAQLGNARAVGMMVAIVALVVFGAGSFITALLGLFDGTALAIAFGAIVPAIFAYFLYRQLLRVRSATGSALALRTESFRRFLEASEGQHVDWAWKQGLLREYSAWAVALGAAGAWSKALNRSHVPPAEAAALSHPMLIYSMGSSISSSHTAPSSSGSGSSGGSFSGRQCRWRRRRREFRFVVSTGVASAPVATASPPWLPRINIAAKVALVLLLAHAAAFPDLSQYQGKGTGWRILLYPLSALLVPLVWRLLGERRRAWRYPHIIDLCVIAPFLIDTAGNTADLYDSVVWWDDVMHFVTWVPWVVGFGLALRYIDGLARWTVFGLTVGFGAVTHIIWELMEYVAFIRGNPDELENAYRDTMGDLTLSLTGSMTGAALCATVLWTIGRPVAQTR